MPRKLTPAQQSRVTGALALGTAHKQIAEEVGISLRQVRRIKFNLVHHQSVMCPKEPQQGRKPSITKGMAAVRVFPVL